MKFLSLAFFFLFIAQLSQAQNNDSLQTASTIANSTAVDSSKKSSVLPGKVEVYNQQALDTLTRLQKKINRENCPQLVQGYKVQIFSCSGSDCPEKAEKNYNQFLIAYPDIPAEKIWEAPSYKVRVGNCRNRFEAEAIKAKIKEDFPFIFIVPDYISSPFKVECEDMK